MQTIEINLTRIAIKNLVISPLNVRKKGSSGIAELAALIASQGLIHNLVVTEQKKKSRKTGRYEVVAGGRRLAALNLLVAEERLSKDHEVNCRIVGAEEALEVSLAENSGREAMHPADLVMAYRNLTEAGLSPDEIAPRFGVSPLTVKRYLKLTNVSPVIFQLYAEDKMNFEQISALALTEDHELQERIWNSTFEWQRNGSTFRRLITGTEIDIRHNPLARFIGVGEYEAEQSRASIAIEDKYRVWQTRIEAAGQGGKSLFQWLLEQPQQNLLDLLAFCTAVSVNTVASREHAPSNDVAALMNALNLDMAEWWEPTPENYLSHVSKDRILEVVAEVVSPQMAQTLTKMKKGQRVEAANAKLAGSRWLPDNFKATSKLD